MFRLIIPWIRRQIKIGFLFFADLEITKILSRRALYLTSSEYSLYSMEFWYYILSMKWISKEFHIQKIKYRLPPRIKYSDLYKYLSEILYIKWKILSIFSSHTIRNIYHMWLFNVGSLLNSFMDNEVKSRFCTIW